MSTYIKTILKAAVKTVSIKDAVDVRATKTMEQTPVAEMGNKKIKSAATQNERS